MKKRIDEYLVFLSSVNYSDETVSASRRLLTRFYRWQVETFHDDAIDHLTIDRLKKWHGHLSMIRTEKGYPLKPTSINRHIIAVRGFIRYLFENGYIHVRLSHALPYLKEPKTLPGGVLTHAQMRTLLSKMPVDSPEGYRNRAMLELLYSSGIRVGEVLKMNIVDIDFKNRTALVNGKGRKQRMVPIGRTALRYLESYILGVRPFLDLNRNEKALFLQKNGKRLSYQNFRFVVVSAAKRSGLDMRITPHTFRRSCTTELIRGGANMYHVKELLGHESLDTLNHYAKLTITDLKKTHEKCHPRERESR